MLSELRTPARKTHTSFVNFLDGRKEYKELMQLMAHNREKLEKDFTTEQSERLSKCDDAINKMHSIAEAEAFKYGFRLALNLTVEAMSEKVKIEG